MRGTKGVTKREIQIALGATAALLLLAVISRALSPEARRYDFSDLYTGGLMVRQGRAAQLYDVNEQARVELELFHRTTPLVYLHPPVVALLLAPLTRLPYPAAYLAWGVVNIALWMLFVCLIRPWAPVPKNPFRYLLLCFGFFPAWDALLQGQTSLLLLGLYSLAFVCLKRQQDFRAGLFLGLGLFKFPIVLPFAFICLLRGKWRLMGGFGSAAFLLGAVSLIAAGPAGVHSYVNLLLDIVRNPANPAYAAIFPWYMPTVRGLFSVFWAEKLVPHWVNAAQVLVSASLILFTAWRWRREDRRENGASADLMFAAALTVTQVTAPHLNTHDLTLMLLAVLLVIGSSQWSEKSGWRLILIVCLVVLYSFPLYPAMAAWNAFYVLGAVLVAFAIAALGLAGRPAPSSAALATGQSASPAAGGAA